MLMLACANSSQHTVNLHSTPFAVRSVQNTSSQHNQFQRQTNMMIINSRHLHYSLIITAQRFKTKLKFIFDLKPISLITQCIICLLYTSPSPRDRTRSRMPSSA